MKYALCELNCQSDVLRERPLRGRDGSRITPHQVRGNPDHTQPLPTYSQVVQNKGAEFEERKKPCFLLSVGQANLRRRSGGGVRVLSSSGRDALRCGKLTACQTWALLSAPFIAAHN